MGHFVYIVRCTDGSFYTGWSTDVINRVKAHNKGKGAKYTKGRGPVTLVYWEELASKREALRREASLKKWSHQRKEELVERRGKNLDENIKL